MFSYPKAICVLLSFTKFRFIFLSLFAFDTLFNFLLASKIVSTIPLILQLTQTFRIKTNILSLQRCYKNVLQAMIAFTIERAASGWVLKKFLEVICYVTERLCCSISIFTVHRLYAPILCKGSHDFEKVINTKKIIISF